jgi:two-component system, response regulator YesN
MTDLANRAAEFILRCPNGELGELSVSKLARIFEVSESFLSREFKRKKSYTIGKFIFRERMFRAGLLLMGNEEITVKTLSRVLGFLDYEYFLKAFKAYYGVSPTTYRNWKEINRLDE